MVHAACSAVHQAVGHGQVAAGLGLQTCRRKGVGGAELPAAGAGQQRMVAGMVDDER
jgi:hypothetical protein